ncbi:MAG TPA: hypothetical protein VKG80_07775, partial [Trebonia sp.]|nr:hypothetical protein [Trebonia sp.]
WFAAAKRRKAGDQAARFPRRRRGLVPVRWYAGTFGLDGRVLRIPAAPARPQGPQPGRRQAGAGAGAARVAALAQAPAPPAQD